jgi:flagellar basal body P-ring protein FlgI
MQLNSFGPVKLILGLLGDMRERRSGQIVNVSTLGVQTNAPRFSSRGVRGDAAVHSTRSRRSLRGGSPTNRPSSEPP